MPRTHLGLTAFVVISAFISSTTPAVAQEVKWRHDYTAARREASETGRPLLLDFGTEACVWCRKLDATTFRDPKVVKLLNDRFIAVKIDANKEQRLTAALRIESFPTLVLATPEGKVAGRHEGYADVAQLVALLNQAPVPTRAAAAVAGTGDSEVERSRRAKQQLDADLAALHSEIAATLGR